MKRILRLYIYALLLFLLSQQNLLAQQVQTPYSIGYIGGRKGVKFNSADSGSVYFNTFNHALTGTKVDGNGTITTVGFPYNVQYFPTVFDQELFCSKGYNPSVVQLRWSIIRLSDRIERFFIYRKPLGVEGDSTLVANLPPDQYTWSDEYANKGTLYKYTVYAKGIADELSLPYYNYIEGTGFTYPVGTASGRITFEGGTAVEGVTVVAEATGNLGGKSVFLDGVDDYLSIPHKTGHDEVELNDGFTFQLWTKYEGSTTGTLFSKGNDYSLTYDGNELNFTVKDVSVTLPFIAPADTFFHVTASYDTDSLILHAIVNDTTIFSKRVEAGTQPPINGDELRFGRGASVNYYKGYIDEIRLWKRKLSLEEVLQDYSRYIAGHEEKLAGYWRLSAGIDTQFFDMSRNGNDYNENHGNLSGGSWTTHIPTRSQLGFKGVTDVEGNYSIAGFPYETTGTQYHFIPMLGAHQFDPTQQIRFVGDGAAIHNEVDFKDISSFKVSGTVRYRNTNFMVEGVSILIDGKVAVDREGNPIQTDNMGRFEVDVPIGKHSFKIQKNQHGFLHEGRFPAPDTPGTIKLHDYQQPIVGLEFIDTTLVKVAGKVVGGPVEGEKLLGFGEAKNNIGQATIHLTTEKGHDITLADSTANYIDKHIENEASFSTKYMEIKTDASSGEYVAWLLPEKYNVTGISTNTYTLDDQHHVTIDLQSTIWQHEVKQDTVSMAVNSVVDPTFPTYDPLDYDSTYNVSKGDTIWTVAVDTFHYQHTHNFIHRVSPSIQVTNLEGKALFGDTLYVYENENLGIEEDIPLIKNDSYTFGHPVFTQRKKYKMYIELYEEYINRDSGSDITEKVPVTDGKIEIQNNFSASKDKITMLVNKKGKATYTFTAGLPEINKDNITPANSYTKTVNITALSGNNNAIKTVWRDGDPLRGFVFGGMPTGNNFVTNGPTEIMSILRDPAGSNSYTYLSQGTTITNTTSWDVTNTFSQEGSLTFHLGAEVKVFAGIGAGTITETEFSHDIDVGWSSEEVWNNNNEKSTTITTSKTWTTSDSDNYVGADGDVFIGRSTNLVYGKSLFLQPIPVSECDDCSNQQYGDYKLGIKEGLRINPKFATSFIYTQYHIENALLPNLKEIRNSFLIYSEHPENITPTNEPVYVSLVPKDDPRFGSANNDESVWGTQAITDMEDWGNGPSYIIKVPQSWIDDQKFVNDTVHYYNQQIGGWEFWLKENERQKLEAEVDENISFDAGTTYEQSTETVKSETTTTTFEFFVNPSIGFSTGQTFNKFGMSESITLAYGHGESDSETTTTETSTTYGFSLADENVGDYYSIDVKKPKDGFGPVFKLRAGVTSCPYEGGQFTKYYQPGLHSLQEATMKREVPVIEMEQSVAKDIPDNRAAEFTLLIKNSSETEESNWCTLTLDDSSNPFGAEIKLDGEAISDGRSFRVPYGQILQKTLKVYKGQSDQMDYEDLKLVLSSLCDDNLADTVRFSAYFLPGCSDIEIEMPKDQWVVNTNTTPQDSLLVKLKNYDLSYDNFKQVVFQYKPTSSSQWTSNMYFYNPNTVSKTEFDNASEPKAWIDGPEITYLWDMHSLPDRTYDIRAKAVCELGPGNIVETPTETLTGIKDVKRPKVFGTPQPADGILSPNDEIAIQFDEPIEAGLLTPFNFSVQGVLNGAEINHSTSIRFDGLNDYVKVPAGLELKKRPFTIEFWLKREGINQEEVIFSKGTQAGHNFEIGFTSGNQLFVNIAGQKITSTTTITDADWYHYAIVYNPETNAIYAFKNNAYMLEGIPVITQYNGEGEIAIGKSLAGDNLYFQGNIHDLRIWTKAKQIGEVYAAMYEQQTGSEVGLVGYWPMDEAFGDKALDKARFRHALLYADWQVLPAGKALAFDGTDDYVAINTASSVIITDEMDYSIEFWFKATPGQVNTIMFSSGKGDGTDQFNAPEHCVSLGFDSSGKIYLANNGNKLTASSDTDYRDNNWHHLAVSLSRKANTNLFVDGEQIATASTSGFGGLSGAEMWIGARGYKTGALTTVHDQYFEGSIDDFRIWNLSKKGEQIELTRTSKLSGDEMGLVAYYPFEKYISSSGIKQSQETLDDLWENPYGPNGGTAQTYGATYTDDAPNIKDARPVQKVDFDWAVNNDKIIITPAASMAGAIEKCMLEVTVQNIEDLYENRLVSPVTWALFVDKNQVKWAEDQLEFEKKLYDPLTFSVEIFNYGGTQQSFAIENLPAWLKAQPALGVLEPQSSQTITFIVNEGVNPGYYSEDLYLASDFDYKEKLHIDMRVFDEEPDWQVDPADFQYTMNIIAQVKIDGVFSTDKYDRVAAFVDGECRGVANLEYVEQFDMYEIFLDVFSNTEYGEKLELRVWNASEGTEHQDVSPSYSFQSNEIHGIPSVPEIIVAGSTYVQKIDFARGWSWVSFNLESTELSDVNSIFSAFSSQQGDQVKGQSVVDVFSPEIGWKGSLSQTGGFKIGEMYMMRLSTEGSAKITGQPADSTMPITINEGWNWIGFIPRFNMNVDEAFSSYTPQSGDLVKSQYSFAVYDEGLGWIGTLRYMVPGQGYMFKSAKSGTLVYPEVSMLNNNARIAQSSKPESPWEAKVSDYPFNMSIIAEVDAENAEDMVLAAFANEECRAVSSPIEDEKGNLIFFLSVSGTDPEEEIALKVYDTLHEESMNIQEKLSFTPDMIKGSVEKPYQLSISKKVESEVIELPIIVEAAPNPFSEQFNIRLKGMKGRVPDIQVHDVLGNTIKTLSLSDGEFQQYDKVIWDGSDSAGNEVSAGVYMITIKVGSFNHVIKVIKQ